MNFNCSKCKKIVANGKGVEVLLLTIHEKKPAIIFKMKGHSGRYQRFSLDSQRLGPA